MTTATLGADAARAATSTGPSLLRRTARFLGLLHEVWIEARRMRDEAERRYPRLRD